MSELAMATLTRNWAALPEAEMRLAALAHYLGEVDDAQGAWALEQIIRGARRGDPARLAVYAGLMDIAGLQTALGSERIVHLNRAAVEGQCPLAAALLTDVDSQTPDGARNVLELVHRDLRQLTLGDRRALGRVARGDGLKRLIGDPDPGVITNLLNNPRTTEEVVLAVCARRPTVAPPLACVMNHPRWNRRPRVRLALVRNPYLPLALGVRLLVFLRLLDLESVRDDQTLSDALRFAAERLLQAAREDERRVE